MRETRRAAFRLENRTLQDVSRIRELGEIVSGKAQGRTDETDITVCDLTGTGVQDTAIATLSLGKVKKANAGTMLVS